MGVNGLWKLIEPSGKRVPLETLENKILAVDISIWLHQAVKGFRDTKGYSLPNAHLLGVYHRLCKLLYFRIQPVFVFDGGIPALKKDIIIKRNQQKNKNCTEVNHLQKQLLNALLKHSAINTVLSEKAIAKIMGNTKKDETDMYTLPNSQIRSKSSNDEDGELSSDSTSEELNSSRIWDLHTIDVNSVQFKSLSPELRHEILTELKETRKQSSWGRLHELPSQSGDFSLFQIKRLLTRFSVQTSLEEVEKELGRHSLSLQELELLLNDQGVITKKNVHKHIASDEDKCYMLITNLKQTIEDAKSDSKENEILISESNNSESEKKCNIKLCNHNENTHDLMYDLDLQKAVALSLKDNISVVSESYKSELGGKICQISLYNENKNINEQVLASSADDTPLTSLESSTKNDVCICESDDCCHKKQSTFVIKQALSPVKSYMLEYSGLTSSEIAKIIDSSTGHEKRENLPRSGDMDFKNIEQACRPSINKCFIVPSSEKINILLNPDEKYLCKKYVPEGEEAKNNVIEHIEKNHSEPLETSIGSTIVERTKLCDSKYHEFSSESDEDLIEVTLADEASETKDSNLLQIAIDPNEKIKDDMFKDIFYNTLETQTVTSPPEYTFDQKQKQKDSGSHESDSKMIIQNSEQLTYAKVDTSAKHKPFIENTKLSEAKMHAMIATLEKEKNDIISECSLKERLAQNISNQMYEEVQELLELFGVPYVVAPTEAEAQCAYLNQINLTHGTITDDSDIWLFGGKIVYKNFFSENKHVMEFQTENIEHDFKLSREQMIQLALLVGSDYTTGLQGIGPVTALEILAAFSRHTSDKNSEQEIISTLKDFRTWFLNKTLMKNKEQRTLLRNKLKNVSFSDNFPSLQVIRAYLEPQVDTSKDAFVWSKPDIAGLVKFAREKFGWDKIKSEKILKPIIKRLDEKKTQNSIKDYFPAKQKRDSEEITKKISKRVKTAVVRMGDESSKDEPKEENVQKQKKRRKSISLSSGKDEKTLKIIQKQSEKTKQIEAPSVCKNLKLLNMPSKDFIHQKEIKKNQAIRNKLKAIEVFRKSKKGPGYVKKQEKVVRQPKEDADLSELSSD